MSKKLIKFDDLKVVHFSRHRGLHTPFQAKVYDMITRNKNNSIDFNDLVRVYIRVYGDGYIPKLHELYTEQPGLGDPNTISYHHKYKTSEYTLYLRPYLRQRFISVIGQLIANGCLGVVPILKDK